MFKSSKNYTVDTPVPKCDFIRYTPPSLNLVIGENFQFFLYSQRGSCYFFER